MLQHGGCRSPSTSKRPLAQLQAWVLVRYSRGFSHLLAKDLHRKNASVLMTGHKPQHASDLPALAPEHPETDAVCLIQTFYALAIRLAQCRGTNIDLPRNLQKITRTR
jgi:fructoselysine-6-P-deglycase FrlB-like protein